MTEITWFTIGILATVIAYFAGRLHADWRIDGNLRKALKYEWDELRDNLRGKHE